MNCGHRPKHRYDGRLGWNAARTTTGRDACPAARPVISSCLHDCSTSIRTNSSTAWVASGSVSSSSDESKSIQASRAMSNAAAAFPTNPSHRPFFQKVRSRLFEVFFLARRNPLCPGIVAQRRLSKYGHRLAQSSPESLTWFPVWTYVICATLVGHKAKTVSGGRMDNIWR
jgi:hypothetical protein